MKKILLLFSLTASFAAASLTPSLSFCSDKTPDIFSVNALTYSVSSENIPSSSSTNFVTEKSYVLYSASEDRVLEGENANKKLPVASLTKMMVMLICAEELDKGTVSLSDTVTASPEASAREGAVIWLETGEKMSLSDMLKGIAISSANDAAYAVSEYLAGAVSGEASESAFVELMNKRAKELGMDNTNYENCIGYDSENQYSTAEDSAVLLSMLLKYDNYYGVWWRTRLDSVRTGTDKESQLLNTNKLADTYDGLIGGKTGTTDGAGYCLAAGAERNGQKLIAVILGAKDDRLRSERASGILNYGFANYETVSADFSELPKSVKITNGISKSVKTEIPDTPSVTLKKGSGEIEVRYTLPESLPAPITRGEIIGTASGFIGDNEVFSTNITSAEDVEKYSFWKAWKYLIKSFFG